MSRMRLDGLATLKAQLQQLGALGGQKVMTSALRAAMAPVLSEAERLVRRRTGLLAASLRLAAVKPKSGSVVASAGIAFGRKVDLEIPATLDEDDSAVGDLTTTATVKSAGWRYHFVEFGTHDQPAHPFLRPAMASQHSAAIDAAMRLLRAKITRALKRQNQEALDALTEEGYG